MSKAKTKKARRELKRDGAKKIAAHLKKTAKASSTPSSAAKPQAKKKKKKMATPSLPTQASQKHDVPFGEYDHILLVGEGDFSFTRSLVLTHGCANVTATSFDTEAQVVEKYPNFSEIRDQLAALTPPVPLHHGIDATRLSGYKQLKCTRGDDDDDDIDNGDDGNQGNGENAWDTIVFMFPHTGGLSTDVNRQVRANQALLVEFFKSCLETSTPKQRLHVLATQPRRGHASPLRPRTRFLRMGGKIVVTLFEGEPYTLWNVRDLARHAGLKVVESWKFDASQYPGYGHVRTLGTIEGGGAWRGEDRDARVYVFEKVPLVADSDEEEELEKLRGGGGSAKKEKGGMRKERDMKKGKKRPREGSDSGED